jgi:phage tail sheath protein FI
VDDVPESLSPGVYIEEIPFSVHPIEGVTTSTTGVVGKATHGPMGQAVRVTSFVEFEQAFGGLQGNADLGYAVRLFFDNGGRDAWVVRVGHQHDVPEALAAFDKVDSINLLCLPGFVKLKTLLASLAYCDRRRSFLVADPPGTDAQSAKDLAATLRDSGGSNAAVYFPPVTVADPLGGGTPRSTPPSGAVAGLIARSDMERGVWKAPAGAQARLMGVLGPEVAIDAATAESLQEAGVNAIRSLPGSGTVVWGARTISGRDEWKYVPVRRLALFIEKSLDRGLQWAVFEPNAEPLWAALSLSAETFLTNLWRSGALHGTTPEEAFLVQGGRDVMTPSDVRKGRAVLLVGFAPLKPMQMLLLRVIVQLGRS